MQIKLIRGMDFEWLDPKLPLGKAFPGKLN